jgi:hypothetical protein
MCKAEAGVLNSVARAVRSECNYLSIQYALMTFTYHTAVSKKRIIGWCTLFKKPYCIGPLVIINRN